jgi:hypothetical protein
MEIGTMPDTDIQEATALMTRFAERTGVASGRTAKRYLWTDAFAVCNFAGLARATGNQHYQELALRLVDQVHHTLGRHRDDDRRRGWISGLGEQEGEAHPTRGGLRIGKARPERRPNEPVDERLEWERDGQYFHYLTKWMHALDQVARSTSQPYFNAWARELARTSHEAFTYRPPVAGLPRKMYWKMSIDLTRPQVSSMGQHDPLDGYVTYLQLRSTAAGLPESVGGPSLKDEIMQAEAMIERGEWATTDPLGIGGLLTDAYRLQQVMQGGALSNARLLETLLAASLVSLQHYAGRGDLQLPARNRLAFRELGLAIGLHGAAAMWEADQSGPGPSFGSSRVRTLLQALMHYAPIREAIESFWRDPDHQRTRGWSEYRDINEVMLATALVPDGFLTLMSPE